MNHYFIENKALLTHERTLPLEILGQHLAFLSNNGLFSRDQIDEATLTLLNVLAQAPLEGTLLDLGCGYGVIGIVLAKRYPILLTFADINATALDYAVKNAKKNKVAYTAAIHSDGFENITGTFDTITLNPPIHAGKEVMYKLYRQSAAHLNKGGAFYIVIQKKHGAESTIKELKGIFDQVEVLYKKKGCYVVKSSGVK